MASASPICKYIAKSGPRIYSTQFIRGIKYFSPPKNYDNIVIPEKGKPKYMEKVPQPYGNVKMPKMTKNLRFMRGPEEIHNSFIHQQYGIVALGGGRLKFGHFEMIRLTIGRKMDTSRMFTQWRIDAPWQPVTKKGQGQRMGGGKGSIDHYVTPVKAGRVIIELSGKCEFDEVKGFLGVVAANLPFKAIALSHEMLEERKLLEKKQEEENINPYTFEYLIKNNIGNCHSWIKRIDHFHFGKYV
ncbi:39S ribosomal protein L16, mitochondrial [Cimex lectularius]|uniref:Large ribosomal subunit protein uL16m n=1 Tax=Cimex lectularius TaxID=79782 RepID=A0A8I6RHE0_CIMLE|nr:39S ribosomal protein L16, mitochondrial [Cimex lectularius]